MHKFEPTELKALFGQLVDSVGTQEAAATFLEVSRQRVGQLVSTSCPDLPTWAQVFKLEQVCGVSMVFAALARRASGPALPDAVATGLATASASAGYNVALHSATADGTVDAKERARVVEQARVTLECAQRQYDAALALPAVVVSYQ